MTPEPKDSTQEADLGPLVLRLERHRLLIIIGIIALLILIVTGTSLLYVAKRTMPLATASPLCSMAQRHYDAAEYEAAIATLEELHTGKRGSATTETLLANAYFQLGRYGEAEAHYRTALEAGQAPRTAYINLGLCLYRQGREQEAIACYEDAIENCRGTHPAITARARTCLRLIRNEPRDNS